MFEPEASEFTDKVVSINRVAKVVKGGRRFRFSAIVVVGDGQGKVGAGLGKAHEVPEAIRKAVEQAKKSMITVPLINSTIPYQVTGEFGAGPGPLETGFGRDRRHCRRSGAGGGGSGGHQERPDQVPGFPQSA